MSNPALSTICIFLYADLGVRLKAIMVVYVYAMPVIDADGQN